MISLNKVYSFLCVSNIIKLNLRETSISNILTVTATKGVRSGSEAPVDLILIPAAFTETTGKAHWESLIRARAIENLCYVLAPAQGGYHTSGRETHGNSMIVDPWGVVLDRLPRGSGVVISSINRDYQNSLRKSLPALQHRTIFE